MANGQQRKTFLSYSRANKDFAIKLAKELKSEGFYLWLDQLDIPAGARWDVEVEKALEECEIFMIIMTKASITSENVRDEIGYAIDNGKRFLPVLLENCNVPLRLRRFQYVDFTTKSFDDGVESAKELLRNLIAQTTIPRGVTTADVQAETEGKAKEEADRLAAQKAEAERIAKKKAEADRSAKQKADEESVAKAKAETERKAKEEADRLAAQKTEADRLAKKKADEEAAAKAKAETERKARDEADRLAAQKAEAERLAKKRAEEESVAKAKAETDRKAKEETDRLTSQKAESNRLAKQESEADRLAPVQTEQNDDTSSFAIERDKVQKASMLMTQGKELLRSGELSQAVLVFQQILTLMPNHEKTLALLAEAETGIKHERASSDHKAKADSLPFQAPLWSAVAWITLGWVIGSLVIAYTLKDYLYYRGYTNFTDTFLGAVGGAVIGMVTAVTLKRQRTISNWISVLWITLIAAISFSIAVVKGEQSYHFATNGAIFGAIGGLGIAFVLKNIRVISNWKSMVWITLFGALGSAVGFGAIFTIFQVTGSSTMSGIIGGIIGGAIGAVGLIWQIRQGMNTNLSAESAKMESETGSTVTGQTIPGTSRTDIRAGINAWIQTWWKRGLIVTIVMAVLGFVLFYLAEGYINPYNNTPLIVISIIVGVFGFMFYPHKISYIMTAVLVVFGIIIWFFVYRGMSGAFYVASWLGMGSGFILSAIISRILHAIKKI